MCVAAHFQGIITRLDPYTGKSLGQVGMSCDLRHPVLSPRGDLLADSKEALYVWETATGHQRFRLPGSDDLDGRYNCLVFAPDSTRLAVGRYDGEVRIVEMTTGKLLHLFATDPYNRVSSLTFWKNGGGFAVEKNDSYVLLERMEVSRTNGHPTVRYDARYTAYPALSPAPALANLHPYFCRASPDGTLVATDGKDGLVRLVRADTGEELRVIGRRGEGWRWEDCPITIAADGRAVAIVSETRQGSLLSGDGLLVRLWDVASGELLTTIDWLPTAGVKAVYVAPRGEVLAIAGTVPDRQPCVTLWDGKTGREIVPKTGSLLGSFGAFSSDGRLFALGGQNLTVWDVLTWQVVFQEKQPAGEVGCCFSPNSAVLACGYNDGRIRLLDATTGQELHLLRGHRGAIRSLDFTADGTVLGSSSADGTSLLWDVADCAPAIRREPLTGNKLDALWADLASDDAATAQRAAGTLFRAGPQATTFLHSRMRPLPAADKPSCRARLAELDNDDFAVRERAMTELAALERTAAPLLQEALDGKLSPEVKYRVEKRRADVEIPTASPERLRDLRALEVLERLASPQAAEVLESMAGGAAEARVTQEAKAALARLRPCKTASGDVVLRAPVPE